MFYLLPEVISLQDPILKNLRMTIVQRFEMITDLEIISRILSGEVALYEVIIRRYNPYLYKIGRSYGYSQHDTEDLMQDSFLSAYSSLQKFENRASLKTWLVRIMLNQCYHKRQKFSFRNEIPSDKLEQDSGIPMFSQNAPNTSQTVMNNELKHILETALLQIPEDYRNVFTLRELNGMSTRETSEALEISEANVKVRLNRAKAMLRSEIEKVYSPEEIYEFNLIYCNRIVENVFRRLDEKKNGRISYARLMDIKKELLSWVRGFSPSGKKR